MRIIKLVFFLLLFLLVLLVGSLTAVTLLGLSTAPAFSTNQATGNTPALPADIEEMSGSNDGLIAINDRQLSELLRQQLHRAGIDAAVQIAFTPSAVNTAVSTALPIWIERKYLNIKARAVPSEPPHHLTLQRLQLGAIDVPGWLIEIAQPMALQRCKLDRRCRSALDAYRNIEQVKLQRGTLKLRYTLGADTLNHLPIGSMNINELELHAYFDALHALGRSYGDKRIPLHGALQQVFELAATRSINGDAVQENTAALMALAMQNAGTKLQDLIQTDVQLPESQAELELSVHRRRDLAQHFVNSAALYLLGGAEFSDYVGIYKEFLDVSSGKEFGTGDLVADRAGVRFARLATSSDQKARDFQQKIRTLGDTDAYLLTRQAILELEQQYDVRTTAQINEIVTVIDTALDQLPLLN